MSYFPIRPSAIEQGIEGGRPLSRKYAPDDDNIDVESAALIWLSSATVGHAPSPI